MSWIQKLFEDNDSDFDPLVDLYLGEDEDDEEELDWFQENMEEKDKHSSRWLKIHVSREDRIKCYKP